MEQEKKFTLAESIALAQLESKGQILVLAKQAALDQRRHAREAWETAARRRNVLRSNLVTEPKFIADTIQRLVTILVHDCDDLTSASETGSALAGWKTIETVWPERKARFEEEIGQLDARIIELQAEEQQHLKREAELAGQIEKVKHDARRSSDEPQRAGL